MTNNTTTHTQANTGHTIPMNFMKSILYTTILIVILSCVTPLSAFAQNDKEITTSEDASASSLFHSLDTDKASRIVSDLTDNLKDCVLFSYEQLAVFIKYCFDEPIDATATENVVFPVVDSKDVLTEKSTLTNDKTTITANTVPEDIPINFNDEIAHLDDYTDLNNGLSTVYTKLPAPAPLKLDLEEALVIIESYALKDNRFQTFLDNKELYSEELLIGLANNPEMLGFAELYTTSIDDSDYLEPTVVLTEEEKSSHCPLFLQWDPRWGYTPYGVNYMAASGCGPTALSMVIQGLTDQDDITPYDVATFAMENNYYMVGSGTKWDLMLSGATHFGLSSYCLKTQEPLMKERLDKGAFLICSMRSGDFTAFGHFIVVHGYDDTGFLINDPFCYERSQRTWTFEELSPQIKSIWTLSAK